MNADPTAAKPSTSSEPSTKARSRRTWILVGVLLAVVLMIGGSIVAVRSSLKSADSTDPTSSCKQLDESEVAAKKAKPAKGDEVEVSDKGVTVGSRFGDGSPIVYGIELTNTSNLVAKDIKVTTTIIDENGSSLPSYYEPEKSFTEEFDIPYILPGREFGVGDKGLAQFLGSNARVGMNIEVEVSEWWQADSRSLEFPRFAATVESISTDTVHYSVRSEYCELLKPAMVGVLVRDADNNIIVGSDLGSEPKRVSSKSAAGYPSGKSSGWFTDFLGQKDFKEHFAVDADSATTQVFPYVVQD